MSHIPISRLSRKKRYLQIALNSTLEEAESIIAKLPQSDRILLEAGTPLIKRYGEEGIRKIKIWYERHLLGLPLEEPNSGSSSPASAFFLKFAQRSVSQGEGEFTPYIVADLKMMDRGKTEVEIAARAGAKAAVALGVAPIESLNSFIEACEENGLDAMVDMMNVEFPLGILDKLKKIPPVVILHRGVDEERFNKEKEIPLYEIRRIKGRYNIMIAIAGGDSIREAQRAIFNDADIVVVWKSFFQSGEDTGELARAFLKEVR